jgi:xanthine dehydrogenase accessory factor
MWRGREALLIVNNLLSSGAKSPQLFNPPTPWYQGLAECQQQGVAHVLATIVAVNGSAPRALQAKMVVTMDSICDTLGGGGLEHDVIATARQLLSGELMAIAANNAPVKKPPVKKASVKKPPFEKHSDQTSKPIRRETVYSKHYPLGAKLGQCCGGSVTVMFESFNITPPMSILVFGAGHVAGALMTLLSELPCQVDWVDSRPEMFDRYRLAKNSLPLNESPQNSLSSNDSDNQEPSLNHEPLFIDAKTVAAIAKRASDLVPQVNSQSADEQGYCLPAHIRPHISDEPIDFMHSHGQGRYMLVMTHDHSLDFELVRAAIDINRAAEDQGADPSITIPYIGCIGSATKAKRFQDRLLKRGYSKQELQPLIMPIGLEIGGKEPMAVAVSIAAQILQHYHQINVTFTPNI